jgi:hypothetical protein
VLLNRNVACGIGFFSLLVALSGSIVSEVFSQETNQKHEVCFSKDGNYASINCIYTIKELMEKAGNGEYPEPKLVSKHSSGLPAIQVNNFQNLFELEEITGKKPSDLNQEELLRLRKLFD